MRVDDRRLHRARPASEVSSTREIITYEEIIQIKIMHPRALRLGVDLAANAQRQRRGGLLQHRDGLGDVRRLRAIERRDIGAGQRGERGIVGAQHRRGKVVDARCLLARHDLVAALADLREPLLEVAGTRLLLVARLLLGDHHGALLGGAEREQDVARAGVEQADARAHADRDAPVARRVHLRDDRDAGAVVDRQMIGLHRAGRERAHERRRLGNEPPYGAVEMREPEQLESQLIAVAGVAEDITAPDQPLEHAVMLVGSASERLGDLGLAEAFLLARQQFEDVQPLVEGGSAISVEIVGIGSFAVARALVAYRPRTSRGHRR